MVALFPSNIIAFRIHINPDLGFVSIVFCRDAFAPYLQMLQNACFPIGFIRFLVNPCPGSRGQEGSRRRASNIPAAAEENHCFTKVFQVVVVDFPSRIGDACTRPQGLGFAA